MRTQLHDLLAASAASRPRSPACSSAGETVDYGELWGRCGSLAGCLSELGLSRGDRVAMYLEKRLEAVVALFGGSLGGATVVPINPLLRAPQVGYVLRDCGARFLVSSTERLPSLADELAGCPALERVIAVGPAAGGADSSLATTSWEEAERCEPIDASPGIDADPAMIFYTSGSTGGPKGVVVSHRNLLVGAESVNAYLGNRDSDRILAVLPLSFDAGFSQLTTGFSAGAEVVLLNYLLPNDVIQACAEHAVTALTCVPPLWTQLAEQEWPAEAAASLRYFASTGGRMPRATLERLRSIFPEAKPFLMYGLTEAFRSTYLDPEQVDRRPDSIGRAIPNAEVLVVRDDGSLCEPGEKGELVHRGALVSMGYWNDSSRTAERFRPAPRTQDELCLDELAVWSNDEVTRDEDGFLYFVGRRDEMIKTSGYRVSPSEIEDVAHGIESVRDAVALGVEDPRLGQRIVLFVSPLAGAELEPDGMRSTLRRLLPGYMVPAEISVEPELPRSPNGKLDRQALRESLSER